MLIGMSNLLYSALNDPVVSPCTTEILLNSDNEDDDNYYKYTGDICANPGVPGILADLYGELIPVLYHKEEKHFSEDDLFVDILNKKSEFNFIKQDWDVSLKNFDRKLINEDLDLDLLEVNGIDLDCLLDDLTGIKDDQSYENDDDVSSGQSSTFSPLLGDTSESGYGTSPPHIPLDLDVLSSLDDSKFSDLKIPDDDSFINFPIKKEISNQMEDLCSDKEYKTIDSIPLVPIKTELTATKYESDDDDDEEIKVDDDFIPVLPNTYPLASQQLSRNRHVNFFNKKDRSPFGSNTAPSYVDHSGRLEKISRGRMHVPCCDSYRSRSSAFSSSHHHHHHQPHHGGHRSSCSSSSGSRRSVTNHGQSEKDRRREQNRVQRFAEHQVRRIRAFQPYIDQYFKRPRPTKVGVLRASIAVMEMYAASNLDAQVAALKAEISMFKKKARSKPSY